MEGAEIKQHHVAQSRDWNYEGYRKPVIQSYTEQPVQPKDIKDIPDMLLQEGLTGIGLLVMGMAVWFLFKRLERQQREARQDLLTLIKEGNDCTLAFTNKIGEFELTVSTSIADLKARMENLEREVEAIRIKTH
jgi:hypothetical protein